MATNKIDLQKYHTAVLLVRDACFSSKPIKRTEFITKHELAPLFFRTMEDLKIIKEHSSNNLTGCIFTWEYKQASNEPDSKVTLILTEKIQEINRAAYLKYSSPEYKAKAKAKKKITTSAIRRPKKQKEENFWSGPSVVIKEGPAVVFEVPITQTHQEEVEETEVAVEEEVKSQISSATKVSFEFVGKYTRQDLINKIMSLVDNKDITSFNLAVTYN